MGVFSTITTLTLIDNVAQIHDFGSDVAFFAIQNRGNARSLMFLQTATDVFSSSSIILDPRSPLENFNISTNKIRLLCTTSTTVDILGVFQSVNEDTGISTEQDFDFSSDGTVIRNLVAGNIVKSVTIQILTVFDVATTITVGFDGDVTAIMDSTENDPETVGVYRKFPFRESTVSEDMKIFITGATFGTGRIFVESVGE